MKVTLGAGSAVQAVEGQAMPKLIISPGDAFGRLTVIAEAEKRPEGRYFQCECRCGNVRTVRRYLLWSGRTQSCGCFGRERVIKAKTAHGAATGGGETPEYGAWHQMIQRCCNPSHHGHAHYGGRGITICDRWRNSFPSFLADMGLRPSSGHSIDRFPNNDGNYEPGNVRWATLSEQARNKRVNIWVKHGGERRLLIEVCEETGMKYETVMSRRFRGYPDERLFEHKSARFL